jgi:hypothetical protein
MVVVILPTKNVRQVHAAIFSETDAFLLQQYLLKLDWASGFIYDSGFVLCADRAFRVDHSMPGNVCRSVSSFTVAA